MPNPGMMHSHPPGMKDPRFGGESTGGSQENQSMSNDGEYQRRYSQSSNEFQQSEKDDYRLERNRLARKKEQDLKKMMKTIVAKDPKDRTDDETKAFVLFEERRQRKNKRSRERTKEKAKEMNRMLSIPENQRTDKERVWLEVHLKAKRRKNEGDRQRRERIKMLGQSSTKSSLTSAQSQDLSDFDFLFSRNSTEAVNKQETGSLQSSTGLSILFLTSMSELLNLFHHS